MPQKLDAAIAHHKLQHDIAHHKLQHDTVQERQCWTSTFRQPNMPFQSKD